MIFQDGLIKAGAGLYKLVQTEPYQKYKPVWKAILAQWVLESGWGRSVLARLYYNFGGMKFRYGIAIGLRAYLVRLFDWNSDGDDYFAIRNPKDYASLYFDFIERPRYHDINLSRDYTFLWCLASRGYVHKMPRRGGGIVDGLELPNYYADRILKIKNGKRFKNLLKYVLSEVTKEEPPAWVNLGFAGAL